jgi:hypothetical protein
MIHDILNALDSREKEQFMLAFSVLQELRDRDLFEQETLHVISEYVKNTKSKDIKSKTQHLFCD